MGRPCVEGREILAVFERRSRSSIRKTESAERKNVGPRPDRSETAYLGGRSGLKSANISRCERRTEVGDKSRDRRARKAGETVYGTNGDFTAECCTEILTGPMRLYRTERTFSRFPLFNWPRDDKSRRARFNCASRRAIAAMDLTR